MREDEKQAAAATRELLKADAAREKKMKAAQKKKGATAAQKKKGSGGSTAAPAPAAEANSSGVAMPTEARRHGGAAAAEATRSRAPTVAAAANHSVSPMAFNGIDGSCFFNNANGFFGGYGQSPMSQSWLQGQASEPASWEQNPTPPGGFTNFIQPNLNQNFHFVGGPSHFAPCHQPRPMGDTSTEWVTYNKGLKEYRKRKSSDKDNTGEESEHVDLDDDEEQPRPMGQKKAKKTAHESKVKGKGSDNDIEELQIYGKIQTEQHANRLKVLEVQQKLSSEKIEQVQLARLAAKEQKEAAEVQKEARKLELEAKMFDTYNRLLSLDVALMTDEEKDDHGNTMKLLKKKLFSASN